MLVKLFNGVCIDPNSVKYLSVRGEMIREDGKMKQVFHVALKTDGDEMLKVSTLDDKDEAISISEQCADKINKAMGEGDDDDGGFGSDFGDDDFAGDDPFADDADDDDDDNPFADDDDDDDPFADDDDDDDPFAEDDDKD